VADYLSKTITEEKDIETAIVGVEGLLKAFQGEVDTIRNEKSGLQKQYDELKAKGEKKEEGKEKKTEGKEGEVPSWAQSLIKSNEALSEKLLGFEQKTAAEKRSIEILAKAKEHGIPENFVSRFKIADDANLDDYMKEVKQEFANIGFEGAQSPESGSSNTKDESEAIAAVINQGTKTIVEQQNKN